MVLLGKQAGLLLQLLVGVLQLFLAGLKLLGQRLGLLEQVLRPHVGLDRIEHDADRLRELIQECLVRRVEPFERRQLQHAADLSFIYQWQYQHAPRGSIPQARRDPDVIIRRIGEENFLLVQGALADQPLAELDAAAGFVLPLRSITRQQLELGVFVARIEHVEFRMQSRHHRA